MKIIYTSFFEKRFKSFSEKDRAREKIGIFLKDPFDKRLNTHKLKGKLKRFYAFSVNHESRVIFTFSADKKTAYFHYIGGHDIYK